MPPRRRALPVTLAAATVFSLFLSIAHAADGNDAKKPAPKAAAKPESETQEKAAAPAAPAASEFRIEDVVAKAHHSVVTVTHSGRGGREEGLGTGFVVSADGLIATNLHVIGEARPIEVEFADGRILPVVEIHSWDRKLDLTIIRVDAKNLVPLPLGDSDTLAQGTEIIALGNPQGLKYSVVKGVVSAVRSFEESESTAIIQVAIPVEPGNSGGPILDRAGAVRGIITFKSAVTDNLGFAVPVNAVKLLLEKPNPMPMENWLTIGALDPARWTPVMGARWTQWAGVIFASEYGSGFGGRSLCLYQPEEPKVPYEISVEVKLDDESGAAGLAFASDGGDVHYGFYPSAGKMRLTRFNGADVYSWKILDDQPAASYRPGEWNRIRVRVEKDRLLCFVNGEKVIESTDTGIRNGRVGLCKFRATEPEFRLFRTGKDLSAPVVPANVASRLTDEISAFTDSESARSDDFFDTLLAHPLASRDILMKKAKRLEEDARRLEALAADLHQRSIAAELHDLLSKNEDEIDLFHAGLLIAKLDNPKLDVDAYLEELDRMATQLMETAPCSADGPAKLQALNKYLFEENGFHGSRSEYYSLSNSYLNEVLDDREGIPITLAILYMELAERIHLDNVVGISLPGHFIVQHRPEKGKRPFIDVFEGGTLLNRKEAEQLAMDYSGQAPLPSDFRPAKKKDIILRVLRNVMGIALGGEDTLEALPYLEVYLAIDPEAPGQRLSRALLLFQQGNHARARVDLRWILDARPEGMNLQRLRQLYDSLEE